jgi:hypothetical protein
MKKILLLNIKTSPGKGIIDRTLNASQVQKHNKLKICDILRLLTLLCGFESWALREQDKNRKTMGEMKFMRRTRKCIWQDYKINEDNLSGLKVNSAVKNFQNDWNKCVQNIWRID